mmetsp:Transcript_21142/g.48928  ORF Transcript_21142/g.48928 Transcript_21142/m.48928 type:complete len:237 (-) Transcript_21142:498-1208(-)
MPGRDPLCPPLPPRAVDLHDRTLHLVHRSLPLPRLCGRLGHGDSHVRVERHCAQGHHLPLFRPPVGARFHPRRGQPRHRGRHVRLVHHQRQEAPQASRLQRLPSHPQVPPWHGGGWIADHRDCAVHSVGVSVLHVPALQVQQGQPDCKGPRVHRRVLPRLPRALPQVHQPQRLHPDCHGGHLLLHVSQGGYRPHHPQLHEGGGARRCRHHLQQLRQALHCSGYRAPRCSHHPGWRP